MATPPTAPGLLMTLIFQPVDFAISLAMVRMTVSVPPPAGYMTTTVIGRSGHSARASAAPMVHTAAPMARLVIVVFMTFIIFSSL